MNACEMVNRCFRHQHPEAFDRPFVATEAFSETTSGETVPGDTGHHPEEPIGNGEALEMDWPVGIGLLTLFWPF